VSRLTQVDGTVERQTDDRQTDIHTDRKKGKKDKQKDTVKKETRIDNLDEKGTPIKLKRRSLSFPSSLSCRVCVTVRETEI
jgi:hypothetical protein